MRSRPPSGSRVLDDAHCDASTRTLRATTLRRNAIERRWIPAHEVAAAELALGLDELEREDGTRVRWATGAREGGSKASPR